MTRLPTGAHELAGFEDYGVDQKGVRVFFGFQFKDAAAAVLHCNYQQLGQCIIYLQEIAQEAFRRMLALLVEENRVHGMPQLRGRDRHCHSDQ
jgi:hypothetical protein